MLDLCVANRKRRKYFNKRKGHYAIFNVYKRISWWVVSKDYNITIATNSICHRRTKGTYPDYNCSDDNARFIALFYSHLFVVVITENYNVCYFPNSLTTTILLGLFCEPYYNWQRLRYICIHFEILLLLLLLQPMTHEQWLVMLHQ